MESCTLPMAISALACALASCISDEKLELTALIFTQLGDTLGTIAAQRAVCQNNTENTLQNNVATR